MQFFLTISHGTQERMMPDRLRFRAFGMVYSGLVSEVPE
jgi:hypothetical protein